MTKLNTLAMIILSTEAFLLRKPEYERITFEEMRENVLNRARQTLEALESYVDGELVAPMAWTVRNAIAIKIGYSARNEPFGRSKTQSATIWIPCAQMVAPAQNID